MPHAPEQANRDNWDMIHIALYLGPDPGHLILTYLCRRYP